MLKRLNCEESQTIEKKSLMRMHLKAICIDHSFCDDFKTFIKVLNGKTFGDNFSDIKFVIDNEEIDSHSEVLQILSDQRQLVKQMIENKNLSNIFLIYETSPQSFRSLLQYVYTGKVVNCDLKTAIHLSLTAIKYNFILLVDSIADKLFNNLSDCLTSETVDDLYHISNNCNNNQLKAKCSEYMDTNAYHLKELFLKRDIQESDANNVLTFAFDRICYNNYIHFLLPESQEICFNVLISSDRKKWTTVQNNENIWSKSWNWVYFNEQRFKYIRIECKRVEANNYFNIRDISYDHFLCKRANLELNFDPKTKYLIPKHDIIEHPIYMNKQYFNRHLKNGYTYCTSKANPIKKEIFYFYHRVNDGKALVFNLCQTCLIDSIRFRLWDLDDRTYDFKVEVKQERYDWYPIRNGDQEIFEKRSSWQTISLGGLRAVRSIKITGINAPEIDPEFALIHLECPPQISTV